MITLADRVNVSLWNINSRRHSWSLKALAGRELQVATAGDRILCVLDIFMFLQLQRLQTNAHLRADLVAPLSPSTMVLIM